MRQGRTKKPIQRRLFRVWKEREPCRRSANASFQSQERMRNTQVWSIGVRWFLWLVFLGGGDEDGRGAMALQETLDSTGIRNTTTTTHPAITTTTRIRILEPPVPNTPLQNETEPSPSDTHNATTTTTTITTTDNNNTSTTDSSSNSNNNNSSTTTTNATTPESLGNQTEPPPQEWVDQEQEEDEEDDDDEEDGWMDDDSQYLYSVHKDEEETNNNNKDQNHDHKWWPIQDYRPTRMANQSRPEARHPAFLYGPWNRTTTNTTTTTTTTSVLEPHQQARVVEFYAAWCPHCQHFRSHYQRIAQQVHDHAPHVQFHAVACNVHASICRDFHIHGYPQVRALLPGTTWTTTFSTAASDGGLIQLDYQRLHAMDLVSLFAMSSSSSPNKPDQAATGKSVDRRQTRDTLPFPTTSSSHSHQTNRPNTNQDDNDDDSLEGRQHNAYESFLYCLYTSIYSDVDNLQLHPSLIVPPPTAVNDTTATTTSTNATAAADDDKNNNHTRAATETGIENHLASNHNSSNNHNETDIQNHNSTETNRTGATTTVATNNSTNTTVPTTTTTSETNWTDIPQRRGPQLSDTAANRLYSFLIVLRRTLPPTWSAMHHLVSTLLQQFDTVRQSQQALQTLLQPFLVPPPPQHGHMEHEEEDEDEISNVTTTTMATTANQSNPLLSLNNHKKKKRKKKAHRKFRWTAACRRGGGTGYTCGLWELFHFMTVGVVEWNTMTLDSTLEEDGDARGRWPLPHPELIIAPGHAADTLRNFVHSFFGCNECRYNFVTAYDACRFDRCNRLATTVDLVHDYNQGTEKLRGEWIQSWQELPLWLWETHNAVNRRLRQERALREHQNEHLQGEIKEAVDVVGATELQLRQVTWPNYLECPACWNWQADQVIAWNPDLVYRYLHYQYWSTTTTSIQPNTTTTLAVSSTRRSMLRPAVRQDNNKNNNQASLFEMDARRRKMMTTAMKDSPLWFATHNVPKQEEEDDDWTSFNDDMTVWHVLGQLALGLVLVTLVVLTVAHFWRRHERTRTGWHKRME